MELESSSGNVTGTLEDAGDFIPYAKKHREHSRKTHQAGPNRLEQLWPEPDWLELAASGRYSPKTLAALAVTYWGLGTGPITSTCFGIEAGKWPEMYERAIGYVRQVFDEATDEDLDTMRAKAYGLAGVTPKSPQKERMALCAAGRYGGRSLYPPFMPTPKFNWLVDSMAELGWPQDDSCLKVCVGVISIKPARPDEVAWRVITTTPKASYLMEHGTLTRADALAAAEEEIDKRLKEQSIQTERRRAVTRRAGEQNMERKGVDYLAGRDVSTDELMATFSLRGIQFGESLSTKERQRWVNEAFCALHDLARVIGFKPRWLGLGRGDDRLALAIGARGHGAFAAHYEPGLRVINLTRDSGAGSLAHEWSHALDHYLAQATFAADLPWVSPETMVTGVLDDVRAGCARPALLQGLDALIAECINREENGFYEAAKRIEELKGARKRYWTTRSELWARSFESYIQDALTAQDEASPWLVHGTREHEQHDPLASAYPTGEQRQRLQRLWRDCMQAMVST